jgi:hypothetical protein
VAQPWQTDGNKNTNPANDFLGTTDNQPLAIRTAGQERMRIHTNGRVAIGTSTTEFAQVMIEHDSVPLALRETKHYPAVGGLWRMPLDEGTLRIDLATAASGDFSSYRTLLSLHPTGNVSIGGNHGGSLTVAGQLRWGVSPNRPNGTSVANPDSIELGAPDGSVPGFATPFIDFHFKDKAQDYNTRIINNRDGRLSILGAPDSPRLVLGVSGDVEVTGDIRLMGADCAEDFDVSEASAAEPGIVMIIDQEGAVKPSEHPYDKRVAGVVSGAEGYKPGIIFDKQQSEAERMPVALMGKVACKVDAQYSPIEVGDLLTTSPTPGHAMKAGEPAKAFGAVLGKALRPLKAGQDLIPVLVALQ